MAITGRKQCSIYENGEIHCSAGNELLVVHIAAERPRLFRGESSPADGWCDTKISEKRIKCQFLSPREFCSISLAVQWHDHSSKFRKILRQRSFEGRLQIPSPILTQLDLVDSYLQDISGPRALYSDRPGQKMRSGPIFPHTQHLAMFRKNFKIAQR